MNVFDMMFFLAILIGVLIGIGLGVHVAFRLSERDSYDDDDYYAPPKATPSTKSKRKSSSPSEGEEQPKKKFFHKSEQYKECKLKSRMQQPDTSFAEFNCQFTGENHKDRLKKEMQGQDNAYHYLAKENKDG